MKKIFFLLLLFYASHVYAQTELKLAETFLKSVQEKKFSLMKPWLGANARNMEEKWKQVAEQAHREGFNIASVTIKKIIPGEQIPGLPLKSIIAVYEYDNKEWDDLMLMITLDKTIKLAEIPVTSYMFMLNDERRGKNIRDAAKN